MVGGVEAGVWMDIYFSTHNDAGRMEWPDGGAYMDQPYVQLVVWSIIADERRLLMKERSNGVR